MANNVGDVYYGDPRAVAVAGKYIGGEPNDNTPHSVVHGAFTIKTNSADEAAKLMAAWRTFATVVEHQLRVFRAEIPPGD